MTPTAKLHTKIIKDPSQWESFLDTQPFQIFVQSPSYAEFNTATGDDSFILGLYDNDKLIGGSVVITIHAKRGNFFYLPYGPILDYSQKAHLNKFTQDLKKLAKDKNLDFIRISPFIDETKENYSSVKKAGYHKAPMHMIAETTWMLKLDKDPEKLLKEMRQNHRNLIRRADRDGVTVESSTNLGDIKEMHNLLEETAKRHNFHAFPLSYLEEEFKAFNKHGQVKIYKAFHQGDLLAMAVMYFYKNSAIYRHGASNMLRPKVPSSYAIQWQAIQDAQKAGCQYYNFWGIAPEGAKKHPFKGITRFKQGFGGFQKDLLPAHDLPTSSKYIINFLIETFRRLKRGF
jgi:lipid II:glycine glycyltransferase (peptidoglycan interpeptide bridge formation enzyme)